MPQWVTLNPLRYEIIQKQIPKWTWKLRSGISLKSKETQNEAKLKFSVPAEFPIRDEAISPATGIVYSAV